jgi:thiol-disulfide isomerase/thioredoxin
MQEAVNTPIANQKTKDSKGTEMLLGHCSRSCLRESPYKEWFEKNYADYTVDAATAGQLKTLLGGKTIVVFMGTWCGDSRREVPRLIKILDYCNVPDERLNLIMVDYQDGAYKQSPQHEEKGKQIFRVPCIIVMSGKKEIGRIVESPRNGLEKDLLEIITGKNYQPNYAGGKWFFEKLETTPLKKLYRDSSAIIQKIRTQLINGGELNTIGYVLMDRGDRQHSIFTFLVNGHLYPSSIGTWNGLANAYIQNGEKEKAKAALQQATGIDANNAETKRLKKLLE